MIEVDVQDVLLWMPRDWEQKPSERERRGPELPFSKQHVVLLKERNGDRALPMWIGPHEGEMLALHLAEVQTPRPLTHEFIARLLGAVGASIERVAVSELRGDTFIAAVTIRSRQQTREVDARPSDAINLAVRVNVPMFVEPEVMRTCGILMDDVSEALNEKNCTRGHPPEEGYAWRSGREIVTAQKPDC